MSKVFAIIDCNNFYVSCERVFNPAIKNKPAIVLSNNDGCAISRSNEAKALVINMGEPYFKIAKLIDKHKVFVFSSNYTLYGEMSARVMSLISKFSPKIEIYSIDECFIDIDSYEHQNVTEYAKIIRSTIMQWTGIPVTVGIAKTKTLAKLANFIAKKNEHLEGVFYLDNDNQKNEILKEIDVEQIWGIGKQYQRMLNNNNIITAHDLSLIPDEWVRRYMNVLALKTVYELRNISCISLEEHNKAKKGIMVTRSFSKKLIDLNDLREAIANFAAQATEKLRKEKKQTKYLEIFIRTNNFALQDLQYYNYHGISFPYPTDYTPEIISYAVKLLEKIFRKGYHYKKAGIILTDFYDKSDVKKDMFDIRNHMRETNLMKAIDKINNTYGNRTIFFAESGMKQRWLPSAEMKSKAFTTNWNDILRIN